MKQEVIAFDIGGTALKMGHVDLEGRLSNAQTVPIQDSDGHQIQAEMLKYIHSHKELPTGIAISAPGFVDDQTGYIQMGGAIRAFDEFNMNDWLKKETGLPTSVENDANAALLAEKWLGKGKNLENFLVLTVGTGIGGGIYINGNLLSGNRNAAGEFGYMFVNRVAKEEEAYKDTMNLNSTMSVLCYNYAKKKGVPFESMTGVEVFKAYDENESDAKTVVHDFYLTLTMGIYNLVYIFDPEKILIGGGITARETFLSELQDYLKRFSLDPLIIDTVSFKNNAGMIGAAYHFWKQHNFFA